MNEGLIKKIVWLLFTLLGVALVISIAPALTMLLMAQFGMSTTMVLAIEIALALVLACCNMSKACPASSKYICPASVKCKRRQSRHKAA